MWFYDVIIYLYLVSDFFFIPTSRLVYHPLIYGFTSKWGGLSRYYVHV